MKDRTLHRPLGFALFVVGCLAFLSAQLSYRLRAETAGVMIADAYRTLDGQPMLPEFQNRVLFPLLFKAARLASPASVDDLTLWKSLRVASAMMAFACSFWCALNLTRSHARGLVVCVLLAYGYLWTIMSHQWEHYSDFFDVLFMALFVVCAVRQHLLLLPILSVAAACNRESAAFGGIVFACVALAEGGLRRRALARVAWGIGCTLLALATIYQLRRILGGGPPPRQMIGLWHTLDHWRWFFLPFGSGPALVAMFAVPILLLKNVFPSLNSLQRGLLAAAAICVTISAVFGIINELRVLLPSYVLLVFALALASPAASDGEWFAVLIHGAKRSHRMPTT
jgi:hypothetical protein